MNRSVLPDIPPAKAKQPSRRPRFHPLAPGESAELNREAAFSRTRPSIGLLPERRIPRPPPSRRTHKTTCSRDSPRAGVAKIAARAILVAQKNAKRPVAAGGDLFVEKRPNACDTSLPIPRRVNADSGATTHGRLVPIGDIDRRFRYKPLRSGFGKPNKLRRLRCGMNSARELSDF